MTDAELYAAVRAEVGKVQNDEELENTDILRESVFILKRIDEKIVDYRRRYFTGEKDISEYSPHDNTVRIQKVYPSDTQEADRMVLGTHHRTEFDPDADEFYLFPSLYAIEKQRRIRGLPALKWGWNHIRRKIIIDPAPYQDGDKYWYISIERVSWTLAALPVDFEEVMVTGTAWKCLEIVLGVRSTLGGIHREGGFANYPAAGMRDWVDAKKDEFYELLRLKAAIYGTK